MFRPFDQKQSIPSVEEEVLQLWRDRNTFKQSMEQRQGNEPFVFYEGPPTANARPAIHHVLARTFKDTICRYQTLKGRYVLRRAGWDTHGLPVELQVEKALGLKNKQDIEQYGIAAFNKQCRDSVWQYKDDWEKLTERMGYWVNMDDAYVTCAPDYVQSVWWALKQVWNKDLVYQDYKVVPYCSRCGTALSLAEVAQGYKEVTETSVYIKFALTDEENEYILAWTTTPWTLPGNVALAVGKNIPYVKVQQGKDIYYLAKDRLSILAEEYTILEELTGADLVGKTYRPLFDFVDLGKEAGKSAYKVLDADFVTTEDGTGVVHTAVMYGEEDFNLGKIANLPAIHTVNEKGEFNGLVERWAGGFVKDREPEIIEYLKEHNLLYQTEQTPHTYPFCWRCGTPLLYYARNAWFIRVEQKLRDRLVELNEGIDWVPDHVKHGRFGNWLEGLRDWSISRERYWGTPLPIWICEKNDQHKVICGSFDELRELATDDTRALVEKPDFDPHKPFIDEIKLNCPECDGTMHRVPDVLDVWFDSGSMPFAQWGYPFANQDQFKNQFPADFIAEGIDQTRGWFNSMLILSTIIFDDKAYKSVIAPNLVNDEKGQKMSKSKGNVVDPWAVMAETGIDALRMYFLSVNQPGDNKNFSIKAVQEVYRKTIMIWWNVANFFLTYAEVDNWQPGQTGEQTILDKWLQARLDQATLRIDAAFTRLDTFAAARELRDLIDELSTWYLRRSRKRRDAGFYATLHAALVRVAVLTSPIMPFVAEATYQKLKTTDMPDSVHLSDFPTVEQVDTDLLRDMALVRQLVTMGHAARSTGGMKVRQPLAEARVTGQNIQLSEDLLAIIAEELNVKQVTMADAPENWLATTENDLTIALDPELTEELREEGMLRDLVRSLQELRKQAGCKPGQLVNFVYDTTDASVTTFFEKYKDQLLSEVAGRELTQQGEGMGEQQVTLTLNGATVTVGLVHA